MKYEETGIHEQIMDTFQTLADHIPVIRVDEFAKAFWGAFTGRWTKEQTNESMVLWINRVAGNPNSQVRVIEPSGEVIATVPPLLTAGGGNNIIELFSYIKKAKQMSKADVLDPGNIRLEATVRDLMSDLHTGYLDDYAGEWIKLYERIEPGYLAKFDEDIVSSRQDIGDLEWDDGV